VANFVHDGSSIDYTPGADVAAGAVVYWDEAEQIAKTDAEAGANKKLGKAVAAAVDADALVRIRLAQ
jgi:predicted RecA/RadA family phage recombinase